MKIRWNLLISLTFFLLAIVAGAFIYASIEGWNFLDSLYFTVMTITTIGYGDFVPLTDAGKIFTIFFSFFGVAMAFYFFGLLGNELFKKHISGKVSEIKMAVKEQEKLKTDINKTIKENAPLRRKKK